MFRGLVSLIVLSGFGAGYLAYRNSEAANEQKEQLAEIRSTLDGVANAVGVSDDAAVLSAVKEQMDQLTEIRKTLKRISDAIGVHDQAALLTAVNDLKQAVATTQRSLDVTQQSLDLANNHIRELHGKVDSVAADIAQRSLDPVHRSAVLAALRAAPNKGVITITSLLGDSEAATFAKQWREVFAEAGWKVRVGVASFTGPVIGLMVDIQSNHAIWSYVVSLREAIHASGYSYDLTFGQAVAGDVVELLVGSKPRQ